MTYEPQSSPRWPDRDYRTRGAGIRAGPERGSGNTLILGARDRVGAGAGWRGRLARRGGTVDREDQLADRSELHSRLQHQPDPVVWLGDVDTTSGGVRVPQPDHR